MKKDKKNDATYGVFVSDEHTRAGGAIAMGTFTGCTWVAAGLLIWALSDIARQGPTASTLWVLSFLLAMTGGGILQQLWFNFVPAQRFSYGARIAGFGLTYFAVLAACALIGAWLPAGSPSAWAVFAAIYLAILAVLALIFTRIFRRQYAEYQEVLDRFHSERRE